MDSMGGRDVDRAVDEMVQVLGPHGGAHWQARAGSLEWSCRQTATHVAHDLLAYAGQLAARPAHAYLPFDLAVDDGAPVREVLEVVNACGRLLAAALAAAAPGDRAWHFGPCDPTGFAAMGVAETLLHTHDITQGLGIAWHPPQDLCTAVLERLLPDAPAGDPAQVLLWSTGRGDLPGRPHITSWVWNAAPP
ncbi:maleylpyruvate isomerase N-terminal domain-containing protein [Streptomyces sp. NRRL WC-3742]|uniref:maleylpyruvate isomerase N-terminal domain-containing protein n=1 Tax=Streptomyces sp. NRRL WC-3742 TaxID=1463934 RepID=UPI000B17AE4B|nr:maleylpyruvate isomerase N-terminal domain-containing protein [Streptomyces sp. NRRL WC-3742]